MRLDKTIYDDFAHLRLRGDFDTFYVAHLGDEVARLQEAGLSFLVMDLRGIKFINSTALGALIKASKHCKAEGGELVICDPSAFARSVLTTVGIPQLIPMFDSFEEARAHVERRIEEQSEKQSRSSEASGKILVTLPEAIRDEHLHTARRTIVGVLVQVDAEEIKFRIEGGESVVSKLQQILPPGTLLTLKFRIELLKRNYFEVTARVSRALVETDGIAVAAEICEISARDREALCRFVSDMEFLRVQLRDDG